MEETMTTHQSRAGRSNLAQPDILADTPIGRCQPGTTLNVTASAQPAGDVAVGTTVNLAATAEAIHQLPDCCTIVQPIRTGVWSLSFRASSSDHVTDVSGLLSTQSGLTSSFVSPNEGGIYIYSHSFARSGEGEGFWCVQQRRPPSPLPGEHAAVPRDDGVGLHDLHGAPPAAPHS
jgi:hypothetical protein